LDDFFFILYWPVLLHPLSLCINFFSSPSIPSRTAHLPPQILASEPDGWPEAWSLFQISLQSVDLDPVPLSMAGTRSSDVLLRYCRGTSISPVRSLGIGRYRLETQRWAGTHSDLVSPRPSSTPRSERSSARKIGARGPKQARERGQTNDTSKSHLPGSLRFSLWTGKGNRRICPRWLGGCNQCEEYEKQRIKLKTAHNPCTILT
jgi:hypothetical protein